MNPEALTGGIVLVAAAALWVVYLLPSWIKKSEYNATEKNAVRLSQTLRVFAETSEVPEVVTAEMSAKTKKLIAEERAAQERYNTVQQKLAAAEVAKNAEIAKKDAAFAARKKQRIAKLVSTLLALIGVVVAVIGFIVSNIVVALIAVAVTVIAGIALQTLNKERTAVSRLNAKQGLREYEVAHVTPILATSKKEIPVQNRVPRPLYLDREVVVNKNVSQDVLAKAREALADAGRASEEKLRKSQSAIPAVTPKVSQPARREGVKVVGGIARSLDSIETAAESKDAVLNRLDQILKNRKVS